MQHTFKVDKLPRKDGGCRYQAVNAIPGESRPWQIYFPQSICRKQNGDFAETIIITTEVK